MLYELSPMVKDCTLEGSAADDDASPLANQNRLPCCFLTLVTTVMAHQETWLYSSAPTLMSSIWPPKEQLTLLHIKWVQLRIGPLSTPLQPWERLVLPDFPFYPIAECIHFHLRASGQHALRLLRNTNPPC